MRSFTVADSHGGYSADEMLRSFLRLFLLLSLIPMVLSLRPVLDRPDLDAFDGTPPMCDWREPSERCVYLLGGTGTKLEPLASPEQGALRVMEVLADTNTPDHHRAALVRAFSGLSDKEFFGYYRRLGYDLSSYANMARQAADVPPGPLRAFEDVHLEGLEGPFTQERVESLAEEWARRDREARDYTVSQTLRWEEGLVSYFRKQGSKRVQNCVGATGLMVVCLGLLGWTRRSTLELAGTKLIPLISWPLVYLWALSLGNASGLTALVVGVMGVLWAAGLWCKAAPAEGIVEKMGKIGHHTWAQIEGQRGWVGPQYVEQPQKVVVAHQMDAVTMEFPRTRPLRSRLVALVESVLLGGLAVFLAHHLLSPYPFDDSTHLWALWWAQLVGCILPALTCVILDGLERRADVLGLTITAGEVRTSDGRHFTLDLPDRAFAIQRDARGTSLVMENNEQRLVLSGPPSELRWLAEFLDRRPDSVGNEREYDRQRLAALLES